MRVCCICIKFVCDVCVNRKAAHVSFFHVIYNFCGFDDRVQLVVSLFYVRIKYSRYTFIGGVCTYLCVFCVVVTTPTSLRNRQAVESRQSFSHHHSPPLHNHCSDDYHNNSNTIVKLAHTHTHSVNWTKSQLTTIPLPNGKIKKPHQLL